MAVQINIQNVHLATTLLAKFRELDRELIARLYSTVHLKPDVESIAELPKYNNELGDLRNVKNTGADYVWNGTKWNKLSEEFDLAPYLTEEEAQEKYVPREEFEEALTNVIKDPVTAKQLTDAFYSANNTLDGILK